MEVHNDISSIRKKGPWFKSIRKRARAAVGRQRIDGLGA